MISSKSGVTTVSEQLLFIYAISLVAMSRKLWLGVPRDTDKYSFGSDGAELVWQMTGIRQALFVHLPPLLIQAISGLNDPAWVSLIDAPVIHRSESEDLDTLSSSSGLIVLLPWSIKRLKRVLPAYLCRRNWEESSVLVLTSHLRRVGTF